MRDSFVHPMDWQEPRQLPLETRRDRKFVFAHLQVNDVEDTCGEVYDVGVESEIVIILICLLVILLEP